VDVRVRYGRCGEEVRIVVMGMASYAVIVGWRGRIDDTQMDV
jgi:hypothetical protein